MARIILLSFSDNQTAEKFAKAVVQAGDLTEDNAFNAINGIGAIVASAAKVEAVIARPTLGCKCKSVPKMTGWTRTKRFGWFVCPICRRPHTTVVRNFIQNMILSSNDLLPEIVGEGEPVPKPDAETLGVLATQHRI